MAPPVLPHGLVLPKSHLVQAEIVAVTSAMRKNARWSSTSAYAFARNTAKLHRGSIGLRRNNGINESAPGTPGSTAVGGGRSNASREPPREADLMLGFESLKREIAHLQDFKELSISVLLAPFLALIKSPFSTGPIAFAVLTSLHSFLIYGIVNPEGLEFQPALVELSDALSRLRFEGSDPSSDEAVSMRLLAVVEAVMVGPCGSHLGDIEVCELLEAVLTICCQMRRGEVLRRAAETTMHSLVRVVFSRLNELNASEAEVMLLLDEEREKARVEAAQKSSAKEETSQETQSEKERSRASTELNIPSTPVAILPSSLSRPFGLLSIRELLRVVVNLLDPTDPSHTDSIRLTALGILTSSLSVSLSSISSYSRSLLPIITDKACKYLFQLVASTDEGVSSNQHLLVLERSLRVIGMLFGEQGMREKMKLQLELFLSFTLDRLAPPRTALPTSKDAKVQLSVGGPKGHDHRASLDRDRGASPAPSARSEHEHSTRAPSTTPDVDQSHSPELDSSDEPTPPLPPRLGVLPARGETRELLTETLYFLAHRQPSFMTDLWVNYDCDLNCEDLFDKVIGFLAVMTDVEAGGERGRGGDGTAGYTSQLLCLDFLLTFVNHMAQRADSPPAPWSPDKPTPSGMLALKAQKKLLLAGTARFNKKPKTGLAFLEEKGLIPTVAASDSSEGAGSRSKSLARFLKQSPRLDKKLLGEFISRKENIEILKEFIGLYDFRHKSVADALREVLESFRLPGEAQQIDRITSTFAECFFASKPAEIETQDAVYILAFAVIMLNTDQHSPSIRKRMQFEDFQKNLRGVNGTTDFTPEYLRGIFDSIRKKEIIMPQEHTGQAGFDYAWKELMTHSETADSLISCDTDVFDETIFKLVWRSVVHAIANAFTTFDDELVVQDVIAGFRQCATLAGKYQLPEVFDFLVSSLSRATGLLRGANAPATANFPVVEVDGQNVTVSPLSIKLGTSFRGQLAAVVLFTIANGNGNAIRDGWAQIFEMFQTLFLHSLLPVRMLQSEDFLGGVSMIPMQGNAPSPIQAPSRSDGGLLFSLTSYLTTSYGNDNATAIPEATERDIECTMSAIDTIAACRLDELYLQIARLDTEALTAALRALVDLGKRRTLQPIQNDAYDNEDPQYVQTPLRQIPYDPASVFLLETMVSITVQTPDKIEEVWPIVSPHISAILLSASRFSVLLIERAVVGLLRIALLLAVNPNLRDQLYISLDLLNGLPAPVLNAVAEQLVAGLSLLIKDHRTIISSSTEWSLVFALIRVAASHYSASKPAFDLISSLVTSISQEPAARMDMLGGLIAILEEFAMVPSQSLVNKGSRRPAAHKPPASLQQGALERGLHSIELLYSLRNVIPTSISQSSAASDEAWRSGWTPLLIALGRQSSALSPEIRVASLNSLQRILLGPQLIPQGGTVQTGHVFYNIIFPMVDDVLSTDLDAQRGRREMTETRSRASTLLCKSFLQLEMAPSVPPTELREVWLIILDFMERLMHSGGKQDHLSESIPESLKNVVLVMNASGILSPSAVNEPDQERAQLWKETHDRLEQFLPGFLDDLVPTPPPEPQVGAPDKTPSPADP